MNSIARQELIRELAELGKEYAPLRFGQLVCYAATLVGGKTPQPPFQVSDPVMLDAVRQHRSRIEPRDLSDFGDDIPGVRPARRELIEFVLRVGTQYPFEGLGELLSFLGDAAGHSLYDIEDEQLRDLAQQYWEQRGKDSVVITSGGGGDEELSPCDSEN